MEYTDFIKETVCKLEQENFEQLRTIMLTKYLSFAIIEENQVSREILAEKICDYFIALEIKTGKSFDKQIESCLNDLDSIVAPWIAKTPPPKRKNTEPVQTPRSRKYYERALQYKNTKEPSVRKILDCSRLLFCLYMEIINNNHQVISNFNYSINSLDPQKIIESMENEEIPIVLPPGKKKRFDIKYLYSSDTCTFIIAIIILFSLINENVEREICHE